MRNGFLLSLTALVLGTSLAPAQLFKVGKKPAAPPPVTPPTVISLGDPIDPPPPPGAVVSGMGPQYLTNALPWHGEEVEEYPSTTFSAFAGDDPLALPKGRGSKGSTFYGPCGPDGVFWFDAELLMWWTRGVQVPALVTSSTIPTSGGVLGQPGTTILYGSEDIKQGVTPGARFNLGVWIDDNHCWGLEGNFFYLASHAKNVTFAGSGALNEPVLARPFFNVNTNAEDSALVSFPGSLSGNVRIRTSNRLSGGEANILCNTFCGRRYRLDALVGLRYFQMNDGLSITEEASVVPNVNVIPGSRFNLFDQFDTTNQFWGANLGFKGEARLGQFYTAFTGKVAIGGVQEVVTINGATNITTPGFLPFVAPGGLLAQVSNIGRYTHRTFAILPEVGLDLGYQICPNTRVYVGYTLLYLNHAARPGDQIDRGLNPALFPINGFNPLLAGPARPAFTFRDTDFWAQGARVGLEFRY
jgi:hypothetical protein